MAPVSVYDNGFTQLTDVTSLYSHDRTVKEHKQELDAERRRFDNESCPCATSLPDLELKRQIQYVIHMLNKLPGVKATGKRQGDVLVTYEDAKFHWTFMYNKVTVLLHGWEVSYVIPEDLLTGKDIAITVLEHLRHLAKNDIDRLLESYRENAPKLNNDILGVWSPPAI